MTTADEHWARLDRRTLPLTAIYLAGYLVVAAVPTSLLLARGGVSTAHILLFVGLPALLVLIGGVLADYVRWRYTYYRITDDRIEKRFDLVLKSRKSIALDRVRTADISSSIAHRALDLAKVKIGTGQKSALGDLTLTLDPLARDDAERLRAKLLRGTAPRTDGEQAGHLLASFRWSWLRYAPISIATPILGASALGLVVQGAEWLDLQGAIFQTARDLARSMSPLLFVAALAAVGMVVGTIAALLFWVELWWSYRLTRDSGTLLVRRGLITTRSLSLEERRVRGIEIVEPLGARLAGAARVDAVASGLTMNPDEQRNDPRTLLPAVPRELAYRVAADILREPVVPTAAARLTPHPPAARRRRLVWAIAAVALLTGVLALLRVLIPAIPAQLSWIIGVLLLPVAVALALDAYRSLGHAITGRYLIARRGTVRRSTVALYRDGIIGWNLTSTPMQRRAGLLTLAATTAANHGTYRIPDVGTAAGLAFAADAVPGLLDQFLENPGEPPSHHDTR